jgi:hypothetical protein
MQRTVNGMDEAIKGKASNTAAHQLDSRDTAHPNAGRSFTRGTPRDLFGKTA